MNNIKVLSWNCNSLEKKYDDVVILSQDYDVIMLQETFLTFKKKFSFKNFHIFRKDRHTGGGGLITLIKNNIQAELINSTYHIENTLETLSVKIITNTSPLIITNVYRPPHDDSRFVRANHWNNFLNSLPLNHSHLISGDFNAHSTFWGSHSECSIGTNLINTLADSELLILNSGQLTHFPSNLNQPSAIDLTIASPDIFITSEWYPLDSLHGSDHTPINININKKVDTFQNQSHRINLKKIDWEKFYTHINDNNTINSESYIKKSTTGKFTHLSDLILQALDHSTQNKSNKQ